MEILYHVLEILCIIFLISFIILLFFALDREAKKVLEKEIILTDDEIENYIVENELNDPRLNMETILDQIIKEEYHVFESKVGVCVLTLRNGYTVTGINEGSVSPSNFDPKLSKMLAMDNAIDKIWALEGYRLKQYLFENSK